MKPRHYVSITLTLVALLLGGLEGESGAATAGPKFSVSMAIGGASKVSKNMTLSGEVVWTATPSSPDVTKVVFVIDGADKWNEAVTPYQFNGDPTGVLDTRTLANGRHSFAVTAFASDGKEASASASVKVENASPAPAASPPVLSGTLPAPSGIAEVDQSLTAATGSWTGAQPIAFGYQWQRCASTCADIAGATASSYTVASADTGATMKIRLTARNSAGSASADSASTAAVQASPATTQPSAWTGFAGVAAYRASDLEQIAAVGVKRVRMDNPSASTIQQAAGYGIDVLPIAGYEPWPDLNGGQGDKYPPLPQYFQTWSDRMIAQWVSLPRAPTAIEVWNEPWLSGFWKPMPDPVAYYNLARVFASQAWKVWPNVKILVSADTVGDANTTGTILWRQSLLAADKDGFLNNPRILPTTHNYVEARAPTAVTSKPCYWDLDRYKCAYNDFKAHGHPNPQVWVTEYGWESAAVGEQSQADNVKQALSIFKSSGMVAATYAFYYKTSDSPSFNWLRPDNSPKPIVSTVKAMFSSP